MTFSTLYFVFVFLPLALLICRFVPERAVNPVLAALSLLFYAWGRPSNLIVLLILAACNYLAGLQMDGLLRKGDRRALRAVTAATAAADVAVLALYKYFAGHMPVGLSFYTFTVLSYLFDVYQEQTPPERNVLRYLLYVSFFPKLTMGPIVTYRDFAPQAENHPMTRAGLLAGLRLFLIGLAKKVLLADQLGMAFSAVSKGTQTTVLGAWLGMLFYGFELYYDFSGYSDMAIGIARMFGFRIGKNFDHPYLSRSVSEFWRRWHISLGNWFKQYVYFPMGGSRVSDGRLFINLLTVWLLTGIWHGNTLNFLIWGLYHGFFVILEKFVIRERADRLPDAVRVIITSFIAFVGWIFFFTRTPGEAAAWFGALFGAGTAGLAGNAALFALQGNFLLLLASAVGATEWVDQTFRRIFFSNVYHLDERVLTGAAAALHLILLVSCVAGMVSSTYSSFLYFRF